MQLPFIRIATLGFSECRGTWRRLIFFVVCLAVGVGAVTTVKSFSTLIESTVGKEAKSMLAGDIEIKSSWALNKSDIDFLKSGLPKDSVFHSVKELKAMARYTLERNLSSNPLSLLVELKALPTSRPFYPMYGRLETQPSISLSELLADGGALVEPSFLIRSGLKVGDSFIIGQAKARISGEILAEPDRISRSFSIGPRVIISLKTLESAKLIRVGSKVNHKTLIRLPDGVSLEKTVETLDSGLNNKTATIRSYKAMQSSLNSSIQQMSRYLNCIGVIALLLGGIGVAMIVRIFLAQKTNSIATLNCMGASSKTVFAIYLSQSIMLGLIGSILGIALGYTVQSFLPPLLEGLLDIHLESEFYFVPALQALLLGLLTTLLFSTWPLLRAIKTRPLRLFRNIAEDESPSREFKKERWLVGCIFSLSLLGILFWQAGSLKRGLVFFGALAISMSLLAGISKVILFLLRKLPPSSSVFRRYGIANIHRPNSQAASIITALGMGIMLVLTIRLVQLDMVALLEDNAKVNPPNYFFIDIQPDQKTQFIEALDSQAPEAKRTITPLVRSRFQAVDGRDVDQWEFHSSREERWIRREFVLTYTKGLLPMDNEVLKGTWWNQESAKKPQVSLEEDAALRLDARLGSVLTMDIQGVKVSAPVTSIRRVDWRNMRTNFYMIFTPSALDGVPASLVATVHVPVGKELSVQHAIVDALPNVTALSIQDIVETVESVIRKLITLVDFISAFSILTGLFILSGSVASTKYRRLRESAILKTLGAKRSQIVFILGVEYATFGFIAAFIGIGLSQTLSWVVMKYLIHAPWNVHLAHLAIAFIEVLALTILVGILSSIDVIKNKPLYTLRQLD